MTNPKPMSAAGLWWPVTTYKRTHFMRLDSRPGDFRFACGYQCNTVLTRTLESSDPNNRCKECLSALEWLKGAAQ